MLRKRTVVFEKIVFPEGKISIYALSVPVVRPHVVCNASVCLFVCNVGTNYWGNFAMKEDGQYPEWGKPPWFKGVVKRQFLIYHSIQIWSTS